jgi:lipoprotein-releasing system permease protein
MNLLWSIAIRHILARKRQSLVSLAGIILGVGFFLAISSMMQGSENDFLKRLVDNSPHITISDEFRTPRQQPVFEAFPGAAVALSGVKPVTETRGIRHFNQILDYIKSQHNGRASPVLLGQAVISFAGSDESVTLNGMIPNEIRDVTTISQYMIKGSIDSLIANPDGIIIGAELAKRLSLNMGDILSVVAPTGKSRAFKIIGVFRTGRSSYDTNQTFVDLKRVQALFNRSNRANSIIVKLPDSSQSRAVAADIEQKFQYKSVSWQEASQDLMNTFAIRNAILYTVVSAVLIVAAFGIYNVISTVVMEKQKDIAILKSMGFRAREIKRIFLFQGVVLGFVGLGIGLPFGCLLMLGMMQIQLKPPGGTEIVNLPLDWGWQQFAVAAAFALIASILAAYLPSRKAAKVQPVAILRGGMG